MLSRDANAPTHGAGAGAFSERPSAGEAGNEARWYPPCEDAGVCLATTQPNTEPIDDVNIMRMRPHVRNEGDVKNCICRGMQWDGGRGVEFSWCGQNARESAAHSSRGSPLMPAPPSGPRVCTPAPPGQPSYDTAEHWIHIYSVASHVQNARRRNSCGILEWSR